MANATDSKWSPQPGSQELRTPPHNDEAERSLLGSIFLDNRVLDEVSSLVQPEDFYRESHRHIFRAILALHSRGDVVDVITLADYLQAEQLLDAIGGPNFLARLSQDVPSAAHVTYYATIVSRKASLRNFITTAHALVDECYNDVTDFEAFMDTAESKLFAITQAGVKKNYSTMREVIKEAFAQIEALYQKAEQVTGVPSGFIDLDEITAGWQPSDLIILAARPAMGKCLSASARVLLANGDYPTIEELFLRGHASPVTLTNALRLEETQACGFLDDGLKPVWRVTTRLGRQLEATQIHPLLTLDGWSSLGNLAPGNRIALPRELSFFGSSQLAPEHITLLAALVTGATLRAEDEHFAREFGLWGCTPTELCLPDEVMTLRREQLAQLLSRLLAHAGELRQGEQDEPSFVFTTASVRLAEQVSHLLLRFGVIASIHRGERGIGHTLRVSLGASLQALAREVGIHEASDKVLEVLSSASAQDEEEIPQEIWAHITQRSGLEPAVVLERAGLDARLAERALTRAQLERIAHTLQNPGLMVVANAQVIWDEIVSIESLGLRQVYDISIPETHNFVANDVCVHNTALTLNMVAHAAIERKVPVAFFSLEMANVQLAIRMLCSEARVDQGKLRTGRMSEQEWARLIKAAGTLSDAPIFLDDTPALPLMEFRSKVRLLKAEQDIGIIFIDYLQLMKARGANIGSREQEISEISRNLKGIAKELNVPVIALAQLNRGVESRADKRPMNSDLRESGAIEQDADIISFIYRDEVYNPESEDKGIAEIILGKHRNGSLGTVRLRFFGQYTRFDNLAPDMEGAGGNAGF